MKVLLVGAFLTVFCLTCCAQDAETTESVEDSPREMREYNINDNWRALNDFPSQGNTGWIPHEASGESGEQLPKKRRLRKRKRRPPMISLTDSEEGSNERILIRKRIRPQRLDQMNREPWEDSEEDIIRRPYVRRRVAPTYDQPSEEMIISGEQLNGKPLSAPLQFQEETTQKQENEVIEVEGREEVNNIYGINPPEVPPEPVEVEIKTHSTPDLKTLLKQSSGTLSLSEILQQKNLSLSELLTGNQKAISALTEPPQPSTQPTQFKRIPPSVGLRKSINRNYEKSQESAEALTSRETFEAQRKRLALLNGFKDDHVYKDVTKYDVITEPTTEKRIFVPSHPKYYTSLDYRPDLKQFEANTEPYVEKLTTAPTTTMEPTTIPSSTTPKLFKQLERINKIRYGNPKLADTIKEEDNYPILPTKPSKITLKEIFTTKQEDEPFRMAIDLGVTMKEESEEQFITTPPAEKLKHVTAKEEIMEILRDPNTRENLARILETRNMTIDELVEQRERGSSQLHLADIFHNKTREPEPIEEAFVGHINDMPINFMGRQQKSIEVLKPEAPKVEVKPKEEYLVTSFPTFKIGSNKTIKDAFQWPDVYSSLFPKIYENNNNKKPDIKSSTESYIDDEIQRLEEIENKLSSLSNDRFNAELKHNSYEQKIDNNDDYLPLPSGVKSAIIASLAIIGASLLVFVTILLIFKWSQKHKTRLNYCGSLTSRIKSPILENASRRSIRSFMNETLGRQKNDYYNYNKSTIQSMSEQIWENDRKPSY